jgi:hypothetical protein
MGDKLTKWNDGPVSTVEKLNDMVSKINDLDDTVEDLKTGEIQRVIVLIDGIGYYAEMRMHIIELIGPPDET